MSLVAGSRPPSPLLSPFDSGVNTSHAWTEHLDHRTSRTDSTEGYTEEEHAPWSASPEGRAARALHDFNGANHQSEITIHAGDNLRILLEDVTDGWSLAQKFDDDSGAAPLTMGLIPRSCYALTSDLKTSPELMLRPTTRPSRISTFSSKSPESPSGAEIPPLPPLKLQPTGASYLLQSIGIGSLLLQRKSLNRFSSFVTSGAEDWILNGGPSIALTHPRSSSEDSSSSRHDEIDSEVAPSIARASNATRNEAEIHFVETPPAWKIKSPSFRVLVHSPIRQDNVTGAYTLYSVTSLFSVPSSSRITVQRRFSQFTFLYAALIRRLPGVALPLLPEKQYAGRFNNDFVEARRGDLEMWLARIVRHPLARYTDVLTFFLGCENDVEWKRMLPTHLAAFPTPGPSFYAQVFHPAFNVDAEEALEVVDRFEGHLLGVGRGVQDLRNVFAKIRESNLGTSTLQRAFSYALLSLITSASSTPPAQDTQGEDSPLSYDDSDDGQPDGTQSMNRGLVNAEGAWCWRDNCPECLTLTKAIQKTAESLQIVADFYDDHARRTQHATHGLMKDVAHPSELYASVMGIHRGTLSRFQDLQDDRKPHQHPEASEVAARCETVLNTTMAEFDTYHTQKVEDFRNLATEHLDSEIALHEQVLLRLRAAGLPLITCLTHKSSLQVRGNQAYMNGI